MNSVENNDGGIAEPNATNNVEGFWRSDGRLGIEYSYLELSGLIVFVLSAISTIFFVLYASVSSENSEHLFSNLRTARVLVSLGAIGLIVSMVGRSQNGFVLAFGVFLIGALIVPSSDIVRFALIASGHEEAYNKLVSHSNRGTDHSGRNSDVANKIIFAFERELIQNSSLNLGDHAARKRAQEIIIREINVEHEIALIEQIKSNGSFQTLDALSQNKQEWMYKYNDNRSFIEDLIILRSEGIVDFAYDDVESVKVTDLGSRIVSRARVQRSSSSFVDDRAIPYPVIVDVEPPAESEIIFDCDRLIEQAVNLSSLVSTEDTQSMVVGSDTKYFKFEILNGEVGHHTISVNVPSSGDNINQNVDPIVELYVQRNSDECDYVDHDDDGGDFLNSQLSQFMRQGLYLLAVRSIGAEGEVNVSITKDR